MTRPRGALVALAVSAALLAACGDTDSPATPASEGGSTTSTEPMEDRSNYNDTEDDGEAPSEEADGLAGTN